MQFDWYQATLNASKDDVLEALSSWQPYADLRPMKPCNGYTHGAELVLGDNSLVSAFWGGVNGDASTHCKATGRNSIAFAEFARSKFPDHQVSRADVAIDYQEADSFKRLSALLIKYAKGSRLKTGVAGDWIKGNGGKTLYLGSRTSSAYLRLYEKGKQVGLDANPHWTRCELEVKPGKKDGKEWLATATPLEIWGASRWSIDIAALLDKAGIARAPVGTVRHVSDDERTLHFMLKQYGPALEKLYQLSGEDKEAFADYILSRLHQPPADPLQNALDGLKQQANALELSRQAEAPQRAEAATKQYALDILKT